MSEGVHSRVNAGREKGRGRGRTYSPTWSKPLASDHMESLSSNALLQERYSGQTPSLLHEIEVEHNHYTLCMANTDTSCVCVFKSSCAALVAQSV